MGMVSYYNEDDDKTHVCPEEDFVKESENIPFETVLGIANTYETIREQLYRKLLLRARDGQYPEILRRSEYFDELEKNILEGNNEEEKVHLALYVDNDLIDTYYGGIDNLVDTITTLESDEIMPLDLAEYLVDASSFGVESETLAKIRQGINAFVDKDYEEMMELIDEFPFPNLNPDRLMSNCERHKRNFLDKVNKNIGKSR